MSDKPKCSQCNERDVFSKGLCSGCYGKNWRAARKAERDAAIAEQFPPKQLTSGVTSDELTVIEGEIVHDAPPDTHLVALNPAEMQAARSNLKVHLEQRLTVIEREIVEANAALNEARRNGWATASLTTVRNRLVDDETYYNKILAAVEAGHTIIPEFPIEVFAVRTADKEASSSNTWIGHPGNDTYLHRPARAETLPAGAGEYRNPQPDVQTWRAGTIEQDGVSRTQIRILRTGYPAGPISFPVHVTRSPIMRAAAEAMKDKVFDQIGTCHPVIADTASAARRVERNARRAGDPLVIGQILHKHVGNKQKCVSFIIAWHLNLDEL
jgi:hypothetical protein